MDLRRLRLPVDVDVIRALTSKLLLEEVHAKDTADVARVISKENTTKSRKDTHEISTSGDGRLDTRERAISAGRRGPDSHGEVLAENAGKVRGGRLSVCVCEARGSGARMCGGGAWCSDLQ